DASTLASRDVYTVSLPAEGNTVVKWQKLAAIGPPAREGHVAVMDTFPRTGPQEIRAYFFGGKIGGNLFDGSTPTGTLSDSLWMLWRHDGSTYTVQQDTSWHWTRIPHSSDSSQHPSARWRQSADYVDEWDNFRLFGGMTSLCGGETNDSWRFTM